MSVKKPAGTMNTKSALAGMRVDGLEELIKTLTDVAPNEAFNLARTIMTGVGQQVAKGARDGLPQNLASLKNAIEAKRAKLNPRTKQLFSDVVINRHDGYFWRFWEHGTQASGNHPGTPELRFMSKSVEKMRAEIPSIMRDQFGKKYEALLKRKAKKAAKNGV